MDASAAAIGINISSLFSLGIDIGSLKSVLAAVRKGGIDIINSDTTNKQTP
jgi:molecular chaperone DnaK (HSP70)